MIMKNIIASVFFIAFPAIILTSQNIEFKKSNQWEFMYEVDGVNFYYKTCEFHDVHNGVHKENVLLKVENTNDYNTLVSFAKVLYYNGKCFNCENIDNIENQVKTVIPPNSSLEGKCKRDSGLKLSMFSRFLNMIDNKTELTKFELQNIKISRNE